MFIGTSASIRSSTETTPVSGLTCLRKRATVARGDAVRYPPLVMTSLLPALAQRIRLPYSVLLALAGSALGLLIAVRGDMPAGFVVTDFLNALSNFHISSQAFLVIFLPTLLFETALAIGNDRYEVEVITDYGDGTFLRTLIVAGRCSSPAVSE